jgi:hypothetical protein
VTEHWYQLLYRLSTMYMSPQGTLAEGHLVLRYQLHHPQRGHRRAGRYGWEGRLEYHCQSVGHEDDSGQHRSGLPVHPPSTDCKYCTLFNVRLQPAHRVATYAPHTGCCTIKLRFRVLQESAWVGLRPGRAPLRLESEVVGNTPVVHCYGHGGSGITLGMGCAEDVVVNHVAPRLGLPLRAAGAKMAAPVAAAKVEFRPRSRL